MADHEDDETPMTTDELLKLELQLKQLQLTLFEKERSLAETERSLPLKFREDLSRLNAKEEEIEERMRQLEIREEQLSQINSNRRINHGSEREELNGELLQKMETLSVELEQIRDRIPRREPPRELEGRVTLKDALAYIPSYDGNNMTVFQFIRSCKRAVAMLAPTMTAVFLELIRQKLTGRARSALESIEYGTVHELEAVLRNLFDTSRTATQCKAEFENIVKLNTENILDYINRARTLHADILHLERSERVTVSPQDEVKINKDGVRAFLNGIPPAIRVRIMLLDHDTLDKAYQAAITTYRDVEKDNKRFPDAARVHLIKTNENQSPNSPPPVARQPCTYCNLNNHNVSNCFKKKRDEGQADQIPIARCDFCKIKGHDITVCRKLERLYQKKVSQLAALGNAQGSQNPETGLGSPQVTDQGITPTGSTQIQPGSSTSR